MSKDKNMKQQGKELSEELNNVSGGAINERTEKDGLFKKKKYYDVTRDDTGAVVKTFTNVSDASNLDKYMNTDKR